MYFPNINQKPFDILRPTEDILNTGKETVPISADDFNFFEDVEIEKSLTGTQFMQDSYFLYNKSNLIKRSFITELNKFISIYGSISCFDSKKNSQNCRNSFIERSFRIFFGKEQN